MCQCDRPIYCNIYIALPRHKDILFLVPPHVLAGISSVPSLAAMKDLDSSEFPSSRAKLLAREATETFDY